MKECHASKAAKSGQPHGPPRREARSRETVAVPSHISEICPHLANKNLFNPTAEIFSLSVSRLKPLKHSHMASIF